MCINSISGIEKYFGWEIIKIDGHNLKDILSAYKKAQGEHYREDEKGNPLFFTTRAVGDSAPLIITENGKCVPDMSEFDKAASLVSQYGGNFGQELAKATAQKLLGKKAEEDAE